MHRNVKTLVEVFDAELNLFKVTILMQVNGWMKQLTSMCGKTQSSPLSLK
jgi:hypothetical protein